MIAHITRPADGSVLLALAWGEELVWLDLEDSDPARGIAGAAFVLFGKAPRVVQWRTVPWEIARESRRIVTFAEVVPPNAFAHWLRETRVHAGPVR